MKLTFAWLQRRFWDFRYGHSTYLAFILSFVNFVVINYNLLISNVHSLSDIFPHLWMFVLSFLVTYPPLAIIIGYKLYRKKQLPTDTEITRLEDPFLWKATPGKEKGLSIPMQRLSLTFSMKLLEKFNLLTDEEKQECLRYINKMDKLIEGKTIG